jgi:RNA-directed DNA polymerase
MMNETGESYTPIVAETPSNKAEGASPSAAETDEPRGVPKWNLQRDPKLRALLRDGLYETLKWIRQLAAHDPTVRFTTLWHHVYDLDRLAETFFALRKDGAVGIDHVDWAHYDRNLEANLQDLSARLRQGAYHAPPVRRVYIPKADGRMRPLGITTLEDKLVQRVVADVLSVIYEPEFHDCSYGFRAGRGQHDALDQVTVAIEQEKVSWVLDLDIRACFDTINHECLVKFVEHRIADTRVIRHIKKWLRAGVLADGVVQATDVGSPQGGSISPLLANIFLHYALDNWAMCWQRKHARGYVKIIRYADDVVACFQYREEAERFLREVRERLARFHLELHPEKTRLLEFGRFAAQNRQSRDEKKPETFNFLGFTHICGTTRKGRFCVQRTSQRKKVQSKLQEIKHTLRWRMNDPLPEIGKWLTQVLRGHYQYYGVPRNIKALTSFRFAIVTLWKKTLGRRSQKGYITWDRMSRLARRWLPTPAIMHPYPNQRVTV